MTGPEGVLGLDIGGANLKAVAARRACHRPFPLYRHPERLTQELSDLLRRTGPVRQLLVTMTGELCDCFASKREGVHFILDAVAQVAGTAEVDVWRCDGRFVDLDEARQGDPLLTAASNWHALATWAASLVSQGPALLIDMGSTTTDIIPLLDGRPIPQGLTDPARLQSQELVYLGARRTPLCCLLGSQGAAEFFATLHDACLVLGLAREDASDRDSADGRPCTREWAHARLARMLCADLETSTAEQRLALAGECLNRLLDRVSQAIQTVAARLPGPPARAILAGSGETLAQLALERALPGLPVLSLREKLGPDLSAAACAFALTALAQQKTRVDVVVKVGGSLFDLPELGPRLRAWLETLGPRRIVLVPGGGALADVIRDHDRRHRLGDSTAHDLALRTLSIHARFLIRLLGEEPAAMSRDGLISLSGHENWQVLDAHVFLQDDASLPASWQATSDSVAARAAILLRATELILLKSCPFPESLDEAARQGVVDPLLPAIAREARLAIRSLNFRPEASRERS